MERSLTMELVRVTEGAAQESARWLGRGKKEEADDAAGAGQDAGQPADRDWSRS